MPFGVVTMADVFTLGRQKTNQSRNDFAGIGDVHTTKRFKIGSSLMVSTLMCVLFSPHRK